MNLDFRNVNTLWGSVVAQTLFRLGLKTAVICPGSRSTPLTIAFAQHREIETIPILDERSAAFLALGIAKRSHTPVVLICTSGTAGANFYPAVIEAHYSNIPLIVFTADRPPELRECHAGQTIDQEKLYGNYPNWYVSLATPTADLSLLPYLRQTVIQAWQKSLSPTAGVVHLNCPFREPLAPITQPEIAATASKFDSDTFFTHIQGTTAIKNSIHLPSDVATVWKRHNRGIIIAGYAQPQSPQKYCAAIAQLSRWLGFPVLAEALSPLRNYNLINPYLISTYDLILRKQMLAEGLTPDLVVQIGELPTSKQLRAWLAKIDAVRYILSDRVQNFDPLHGRSIHLQLEIQQLQLGNHQQNSDFNYLKQWLDAQQKVQQTVEQKMQSLTTLYEGKTAWLLSQTLPPHTPLIVANSMSVRYLEWFWQTSDRAIEIYFSRGANGIDGTLSTALGVAHNYRASVLLTGDLALLHDTNGFLFQSQLQGHLTIVLINNHGGGIFEHLPIAGFEPLFEQFFATPQPLNWWSLAQTYNLDYQQIKSWQQLQDLCSSLPTTGIRLLELKCVRQSDAAWLKQNFPIET